MKEGVRIAALPVALLSIVVGIAGIASPGDGMALRRLYFATPGRFHAVVALRSAMGLGLILAASRSRWPRTRARWEGWCACKEFRPRFSALIMRERSWNGRGGRDPGSFAPGPQWP